MTLALDHPAAVGGLVLLSGYYKPTLRLDVPLVAPAAIPIIGDVLRHTVSPLLGTALLPLSLKAIGSTRRCPAANSGWSRGAGHMVHHAVPEQIAAAIEVAAARGGG